MYGLSLFLEHTVTNRTLTQDCATPSNIPSLAVYGVGGSNSSAVHSLHNTEAAT